jgi:hypothetical protein
MLLSDPSEHSRHGTSTAIIICKLDVIRFVLEDRRGKVVSLLNEAPRREDAWFA